MSIQFTNDATTFLAANINASVTTITVVDASSFPTLASGDHTYITLSTPTNSTKEIVKCTAIVGNTLTVIRAQEGTTAASFTTDDRAQIRITAQLFRDIMLAYASLNSYRYTATAGQTTFTGTDIHSATLAYLPNNIIVMLNGVGMGTVDYTATDGSSIVFNVGATLNDEITIVAFTAFGVSDHYKKSETDALLAGKVDDSQVLTNVPSGALFTDTAYTHPANHAISVITGLQAALDGKVDDSQVLTNVPSGALFTDTNTVYTHPSNHAISVITGLQAALDGKTTESYVNTAVSNLVDSSPATLNTLNELAAALGDDANFSTTVTNSIATKLPLAGGTMTGVIAGFESTGIDDNATSTAITIDSSENVGIGETSPARFLHVKDPTGGNIVAFFESADANGSLSIGDNSGSVNVESDAGAMVLNVNGNTSNGGGNTEALRINTNGNVGIGVVPEAHHNTHSALQVGGNGVWTSYKPQGASGEMDFQHNAYYSQAHGGDRYISTDEATKYRQVSGAHQWYTAASGSADAAISWRYGMQIDNAGIVTKPLQPAFSSYANTQNNMGLNAWLQIAFANQQFDQNQDYASNTFVAPVTGKYQLQISVRLDNLDTNTQYYQVRIRTSNRSYHSICDFDGMSTDPSYWNFNNAVLADMDANDTCVIEFLQAGGNNQTDINDESYFNGYLVC